MQAPDVRVKLTADTSGLQAGVAQANKSLAGLSQAQTAAAASGAKLGGGMQNLSYQLQDFVMQVNGGVSATTALSMQLPQLLGGFGALGAGLGVVVALLPNLISALSDTDGGAKSLKDAMSGLDGAIGDVGQTVQAFDMEALFEQFNASTKVVQAATIEQLKFQQAFLDTQRLTSGKALGASLSGLGEYGFVDKMLGRSGAEKLSGQLGISQDVATRLLPAIKGLRDGTEDVSVVFERFGVALLGGNAEAVALAKTLSDLTKGEKDSYAASSALSDALARMAKGHVVTKKEVEEAEKAAKKLRDANKEGADEMERFLLALDAKELEKAAKLEADYAKNVSAALAPLEARASVAEAELENYGLAVSQIERAIIARIEEARAIAAQNGASADHLNFLDREIAARKRNADASGSLEARRANKEAAQAATREWERTAQEIEGAIYDAIVSGGEDAGEVLERTFKALVLRPIIQPIAQAAAGVVTGALGFGQAGAGGGGSSGGFGSFPTGLGSSGLINSLAGSSLLAGTAAGAFGAGLASGLASWTTAGASVSATLGAGAAAGGSVGAGMMAGVALPVLGVGLGLASLFGAFNKKPSDKSAWATANPLTGALVDVGSMTGKKDPGQEARDATAQLAQYLSAFAQDAGINRNLTVMTGARDGFRVDLAGGLRTPTAPRGNGGYGYNFGAVGEDAMKRILNDLVDEGTLPQATIDAWRQMRTDAAGVARDAQEQMDVLDLLTKGINEAEIERANTMQQAGETLAAAYARMVEVENSIRAAISQTFDTPAEQLAAAFEAMNTAIPQTLEQYEALVRAQDLTTEAGRNQAVALLNAKGAWDVVQREQEAAAEAARRAAEEARRAWEALQNDLSAFRVELTAGALAGLSPEAAYAAAQTQFADTSRLAGLGNQDALAGLAEAGRALLAASEAYNARTGAYFADRDRVLSAVDAGVALTGRKIEGFANGGFFGGGLRIVGERGPELEATGPARYWSAQETRAALGGGGEAVRELQAVVRVLSTGLSSIDRRLANLERHGEEQARAARLAADRRPGDRWAA